MNNYYTGKTLRVENLAQGTKKIVLTRGTVCNAFDGQMIEELTDILCQLTDIEDANAMRLLILTGEGKIFCAGADLIYMSEQANKDETQNLTDARILGTLFFKLASFPCPVIVAVQGAAIAGGLGLAACADFVLAEENAVFATSEVLLGIVPAVISPYIIRKIGVAHATPLMLTGKRISAAEALSCGLVNKVTKENTLAEELVKVTKSFLQAAPAASRKTKELIKNAVPLPQHAQIEYTVAQIAAARSGAEGKAGIRAFFDKKPSPWVTVD